MSWIEGSPLKLVAVAATLVLLAACNNGGSAAKAPTYPPLFTVTGDVRLSGADNINLPLKVNSELTGCTGAGKFSDMHAKAPVTFSSMSGKLLATGTVLFSTGTDIFRNALDECVFRFIVHNVPKRHSYLVTVGRQPPKVLTIQQIFEKFAAVEIDINQPNVTTTTT